MNLGVTLHLIIYLHLSLVAGIQTKAVIRHGGNRIPLKSRCCLTVARSNVDSAANNDPRCHNRATIQRATASTPGHIHLGPSLAFISHSCINSGLVTPRRLAACRSTDERMCREGEGFEGDTTFDGTVESGSNQTGLTKKQYESLKTLLDTKFPVEPTGDEDEAHPLSDIVLKYWGRKPNPRDALMQNIAKLEKEWEATGSREEACKKLNLPQPIKFKPELISAMLRDMFDLRKEPSTFVETVMAMMGFASRETHTPGDGKWPFGIKPKDASIEKPLTRNALMGYLGVEYYRHLEELARRDPDIARRILTVIHRMYRAPQLVLDTCENREPTDKEIYMDSDKLKKAQCVVYKEFIKDYPDLQWPVDDQGFLDIYNKWYPDDALELNNTLPDLMKQIYGPGDDIKPPNFFYRFLGLPAVSCAAGALLGGVAAQLINMGSQFIPGLDLQYFVTNKVCGAIIALGTWFGMSRDLKVKGSVFQLALKTLVDNGMKDNTKLRAAAYSGIIPKYDVVTDLERFVIYATIAGFNRALQLVKEGCRSIDTWNTLARQVGRVAEVCLPMCRVSVYRIIYFAACDLASSDLLPCTHGNEVLGKAISGDPEYSDDDYSELYKEKNAAHGLPPPESFREGHQRTALLFTTFCLQAFGSIKHFTRTSEEQLDRYQEFLRDIKLMKVSDEAWDNLRDQPMQPSLLDDVEKWSRDLERAGGKLKRIALVREYGFNPLDEFMGETAEEKHNRMQIELQEARDAVKDLTSPIGYKLELLKAMSIIMFLREEWLLERYRDFIKKQCVEFITNEIEGMSTDIDTKIQSFHIAAAHVAGVKRDAIFALARKWNEENKLDHDKLLELGRAAGISDDIVLDAASAATFNEMLQEMYNWDLTTVTAELIIEIKERYRCRDLVLINALCESIKKQTAEHKKEMVNAKNKYNWNLVEKHMSILLRGKTAVINAAASTIDCKLWYRIDRAFLQNIPFVDKEFTDDEILGTGEIAKISNQDWEMKDPPPPKSDFQQMDEEFQKELDDIKPLTIYGEDTRTPIHKQLEIIDMVEKGKLDPKFQCIPNVLHVGERPKELEYEIDRKLPEDPYELRRQIVSSRDAYASWVIYCYRKRDVNPNDVKTLLTIFPFLENMISRSDLDWRRLYARQRLRQKDSLGSKVNWCKEMDCDEATARKVCGIAYEEELLRRTGAYVEHIEDDIGDVKDHYFNPFDPSIYNRLNYLYSERVPGELELENIQKLQQFFDLPTEDISVIHTKCFSYALSTHFCNVMKASPREWLDKVESELVPLAQKLYIEERPLDMMLRKAEYDYLMVEANRLMMDRKPGKDFEERCDYIIEEFKRLKVFYTKDGNHRQKFSISSHNDNLLEEIMGAFIISHCDVYGYVDQRKLDEQCAVYGMCGEFRRKILNRLGRKFYHRFLRKFSEEELSMDSFKELEHLHRTYEFTDQDVADIYKTHVGIRIRDWYDPQAGLDSLKRLIPLIHDRNISYFIPFERSRRVQWLFNIVNDCINHGVDKADTRIYTYTVEDFMQLTYEGGEEDFESLQGIINTAIRALHMTPEEIEISRIVIAEEIGGAAVEKAMQMLQVKGGIYSADGEVSKFVRAMAIAPKGTIPSIKKNLPVIRNYELIRKVIMMLPCSDDALAKSIKMLNEVEQA